MKTSPGGMANDCSNAILYPNPQGLFKQIIVLLKLTGHWCLVDLSPAAPKCWQNLKIYDSSPAPWQGPALSIAFPCCTHNLQATLLCFTHGQPRLLWMCHRKMAVILPSFLSCVHSCETYPALSWSWKTYSAPSSYHTPRKLLCCLISNSAVSAVSRQPSI